MTPDIGSGFLCKPTTPPTIYYFIPFLKPYSQAVLPTMPAQPTKGEALLGHKIENGHLKLLQILGRGVHGVVYLAHDREMRCTCEWECQHNPTTRVPYLSSRFPLLYGKQNDAVTCTNPYVTTSASTGWTLILHDAIFNDERLSSLLWQQAIRAWPCLVRFAVP